MTSHKSRKTFRLWQSLEEQLNSLAASNGISPAKMLNILVMEALAARGQPAPVLTPVPDPEPDTTEPHPLDAHDAF